LNVQWKPQIRPFFSKICWKTAKKRTFSYKVACKKFLWLGQRGHRTVKYAAVPSGVGKLSTGLSGRD